MSSYMCYVVRIECKMVGCVYCAYSVNKELLIPPFMLFCAFILSVIVLKLGCPAGNPALGHLWLPTRKSSHIRWADDR